MSTDFEILTELETEEIESCIYQFAINNKQLLLNNENNIVITVWFADMSRKILNNNTPDGQYCIIPREMKSYSNHENINFIDKFYSHQRNKIMVLIEVIKKDVAKFFSVPVPDILMGLFTIQPEEF